VAAAASVVAAQKARRRLRLVPCLDCRTAIRTCKDSGTHRLLPTSNQRRHAEEGAAQREARPLRLL
jgi:hypothetical protein